MKLKLRVTDIKGTLHNKKKTFKSKSRRCFENQPNEIWSHLSEKVSIGWCFGADKLQNHTYEAKGKEKKKKEPGGRKEEKRKKQWLHPWFLLTQKVHLKVKSSKIQLEILKQFM